MGYIVEIEPGVWLAPWSGDPGRTLDRRTAKVYGSKESARRALGQARRHRPLKRATVTAATKENA